MNDMRNGETRMTEALELPNELPGCAISACGLHCATHILPACLNIEHATTSFTCILSFLLLLLPNSRMSVVVSLFCFSSLLFPLT
jgi:hypothetical protein